MRIANTATSPPDFRERGLDEGFLRRDLPVRASDLGHVGRDKVGVDEVHGNALGCEFRGEGIGPVLQESFGARVGCEEGCGCETAEGAHGEDEAALSGKHVWQDGLSDSEGGGAVDVDDVLQLVLRRLREGDRDAV